MRVDISVLGATSLRLDGTEVPVGGRRRRQVLGRLALGAPDPVSAGHLVEAVWGDAATERARSTLHVHVSHLRQVLRAAAAPELLLTAADGYRLAIDADAVDANRFVRLAEEGLRHIAGGHLLHGRDLLADGLALWDQPFPELVDEPDILVERHRLIGLAERAEDQLVEAELGLGRAARVIDLLMSRVEAAPLRETSVRQLVRALVSLGRPDDARRVAGEAIAHMQQDYGVEPTSELRQLVDAPVSLRAVEGGAREPVGGPPIRDSVMRPGATALFVAGDEQQLAAIVDQVSLMAQRDLRRTVVIRPGRDDSAPLEAIDRAIGPIPDDATGSRALPDRFASILRELARRAGPAGLVVVADVDRIDGSLRPFVRQLVEQSSALGITVVGTGRTQAIDLPFASIEPVEPAADVGAADVGRVVDLPHDALDLLLVVSLCDPEIPVPLLVRALDDGPGVLDRLADGVNRHLLEDGSPGHLRLTPVGRAVLAGHAVDDDDRRARHLAVADAARRTDAVSLPRLRAIEARHRVAARPMGDPSLAASAVVSAVDDSLDVHLYGDALTQLVPASELVDELADLDPSLAVELIERLARAHMRGGRVSDGIEWSRRLIEHARRHDDPHHFAEGVRLLGEQTAPQSAGQELPELQREAIAATIDTPTDTTVQLLTDLAGALYFDDLDASRHHAEEALAVARGIGDPGSIARGLTGKMQTLLGPADVDARLELAIEAQAMARRAELRHVQVHALTYEVYSLFERGRLDVVGPPLRYALELADEVQFGRVEWWVRAWDALHLLATGKFADAEAVARDALERYADPDRREAFECYASQLMNARLLTGDGADIADLAGSLVERSPDTLGYRGLYAYAAAQAGDLEAAAEQLDAAIGGIASLRSDATLLTTAAMLAEAAWACRRTDVATELLPLIEPYSGSHAVLNVWGGGGFYWGPIDHAIGLLRLLTGRGDAAAAIRAAEQNAASVGARPFAERARSIAATLR